MGALEQVTVNLAAENAAAIDQLSKAAGAPPGVVASVLFALHEHNRRDQNCSMLLARTLAKCRERVTGELHDEVDQVLDQYAALM
jgi:hypothetical protein